MHVPCDHIWITFNKDVKDSILGMDIIKKLYLVHVPANNGQLILITDRDIAINTLNR